MYSTRRLRRLVDHTRLAHCPEWYLDPIHNIKLNKVLNSLRKNLCLQNFRVHAAGLMRARCIRIDN